jgi:hypothetical protein
MLCRVAVISMDVSEESLAYIIRVTRIGEVRTTIAVTRFPSTVRTDFSEEVVSIIKVRRIGLLRTTLAVTIN